MKVLSTGLVSAAMLAVTMAGPASSADLSSYGGSLKDEPVYETVAPAGGCYVRADIGYGWHDSDAIEGGTGQSYLTSDVDDGVVYGAGIGCSRGRAFRYELQYTYHGDNSWWGTPAPPDPIHADIESHSLMANLYYDWDIGRRFTPYVGAGIGVAYHDMDALVCGPAGPTCNPNAHQRGGENLSLAWSLMTGVGVDVSDRVTLDLGYRFIDLGDVASGRLDDFGFINPVQTVEDIQSHEIKIGVRFALN